MQEHLGKEFSEDFQEQALDLFFEAVEKTSAKNRLVEMFVEMFTDNPEFTLLFNDGARIDAVELMANRVEELEEILEALEEEKIRLLDDRLERLRSMDEETLLASVKQQPIRRSRRNVAEDLEGVDPDNSVLMETEQRKDASSIGLYSADDELLRAVEKQLIETWEKTKN